MISAHAYHTFELSYAVPLVAKTAAREQKLGLVSANPLPYLTGKVPDHFAHDVVLVTYLHSFGLCCTTFPFLWLYYCYIHVVIAGGVTPIDSSHGCDCKVKTLTRSFWHFDC